MAMNLEVILDCWEGNPNIPAANSPATGELSTGITIPWSAYDGIDACTLEIVALNASATTDATVSLVDGATGAAAASVTVPASTATNLPFTDAISPGATDTFYRVAWTTPASNTLRIAAVRVRLRQSGATKTVLQFSLAAFLSAAVTGTITSIELRNVATWGQSFPGRFKCFGKDESRWATISGWKLEFLARSRFGSATKLSRARLWNKTDDTEVLAVAYAENFTYFLESLANDAANFHDGDEFEIQHMSDSASWTSQLCAARLYVALTDLSAADVWLPVARLNEGAVLKANSGHSWYRFYPSYFDSGVEFFFEADVAAPSSGTIGVVGLTDHGSGAEPVLAAGYANAFVRPDAGVLTYVTHRTAAAFSPTEGNWIGWAGGDAFGDAGASVNTRTPAFLIATLEDTGLSASITEEIDGWADEADAELTEHQSAPVEEDIGPDFSDAVSASLLGSLSVSIEENVGPDFSDEVSATLTRHLTAEITESVDDWSDSIEARANEWGAGKKPLVLVEIETPGGGYEYVSDVWVRHPDRVYKGVVLDFGVHDRSIPVPTGFPRIGDITLTLADPDGYYRTIFAPKTMRKKRVRYLIGPEDGSYSAFIPILDVGRVVKVEFPEGKVRLDIRDALFDFLEQPVPALMDRDYWPNLPENPTASFANIVVGQVRTIFGDAPGPIPCPLVDTVTHSYCYARHPVLTDNIAVYRKKQDEDEYSLVPSSEYTITKTYALYGSFATLIVFSAAQDDGALIAAQGDGLIDTDDALIHDATDCVEAILKNFVGVSLSLENIDLASFVETRVKTQALSWTCDGLWSEPLIFREALSQILVSFGFDLYVNSNGQIAIHLTTSIPADRASYDEIKLILNDTLVTTQAEPHANRILYSYGRNHATKTWAYHEKELDSEEDQAAMGDEVIADTVDLYFVRDPLVAEAVVANRLGYLDLDSWRVELEMPSPEVLPGLDLTRFVNVTHVQGVDAGGAGYVNTVFKVTDLIHRVGEHAIRMKGVRFVPLEAVTSTIDGYLATMSRSGPYYVGRNFYGVFLENYKGVTAGGNTLQCWYSANGGRTFTKADEVNAPAWTVADPLVWSYDSQINEDTGEIHCATQRCDGRVEHHIFDTRTGKWTLTYALVAEATYNVNYGTYGSDDRFSIACQIALHTLSRRPSIFFWNGKQTVTYEGRDLALGRLAVASKSAAGTWSTALVPARGTAVALSGFSPASVNAEYIAGRIVPSPKSDAMHLFFRKSKCRETTSEFYILQHPYLMTRSSLSGGSIGAETTVLEGWLVFYPARHTWGAPVSWLDPADSAKSYAAIGFKGYWHLPYMLILSEHDTDARANTWFKLADTGYVYGDALDHNTASIHAAASSAGRLYAAYPHLAYGLVNRWEVLKQCAGQADDYPYTQRDTWLPDRLTAADRCSDISTGHVYGTQIKIIRHYGVNWLAKFSVVSAGQIQFDLLNLDTDVPKT